MTTFTTLWRLAVITPFDPAVKDSWGPIQDATMPLMEQGAVGLTSVNIAGLTSVSLTTANNATDQARYLVQNYTGALSGDCTVTVPNLQRIGWAQNSTTGGFNVILSAGGTTVTLPPDGVMRLYVSDGATNITLPPVGFGNVWQTIANYTFSGVSSQTMALPTAFRRFRFTLQNGTVGTNGAVLVLRLSSNGGSSFNASNYNYVITSGSSNSTTAITTSTSDSGIILSSGLLNPASGNAYDGEWTLDPGSAASLPRLTGTAYGVGLGSNYSLFSFGGGWVGTLAAMNYAQILTSTGTMSGTVILEGLP